MTARDLKDFLRDILLVQRETENGITHYRWRLIGTNLTQIFGHQTGKFLDESLAPEHLARWNHVCAMILERRNHGVSWAMSISRTANISMPRICMYRWRTIMAFPLS